MSNRVLKYPIGMSADVYEIYMPTGAKIISAQAQEGVGLVLYAQENNGVHTSFRRIHVVATGGEAPSYANYISTVMFRGGFYVVHVYEELR